MQTGTNIVQDNDLDKELTQQQQHDKGRARQLEGMLEMTQENRALEAENKVLKGKSTQTTKEWWPPTKGEVQSKQEEWGALGRNHGKRSESTE